MTSLIASTGRAHTIETRSHATAVPKRETATAAVRTCHKLLHREECASALPRWRSGHARARERRVHARESLRTWIWTVTSCGFDAILAASDRYCSEAAPSDIPSTSRRRQQRVRPNIWSAPAATVRPCRARTVGGGSMGFLNPLAQAAHVCGGAPRQGPVFRCEHVEVTGTLSRCHHDAGPDSFQLVDVGAHTPRTWQSRPGATAWAARWMSSLRFESCSSRLGSLSRAGCSGPLAGSKRWTHTHA